MAFNKIIFSILLFLLSLHSAGQTVFKTPSGKKYHLASCSMVKNVSAELTVQQAKETGLEPCKICHPQNHLPLPGTEKSKPTGEATTVRCKGVTKAGTRCHHMTRIGNGYCFQHQPK